jgi:hypothetical protein
LKNSLPFDGVREARVRHSDTRSRIARTSGTPPELAFGSAASFGSQRRDGAGGHDHLTDGATFQYIRDRTVRAHLEVRRVAEAGHRACAIHRSRYSWLPREQPHFGVVELDHEVAIVGNDEIAIRVNAPTLRGPARDGEARTGGRGDGVRSAQDCRDLPTALAGLVDLGIAHVANPDQLASRVLVDSSWGVEKGRGAKSVQISGLVQNACIHSAGLRRGDHLVHHVCARGGVQDAPLGRVIEVPDVAAQSPAFSLPGPLNEPPIVARRVRACRVYGALDLVIGEDDVRMRSANRLVLWIVRYRAVFLNDAVCRASRRPDPRVTVV